MSYKDRMFYGVLYIGLPALFISGMILIGLKNGWT